MAHCYDCHSTDAPELKASLYVDSREGLLEGGDSGPAVVVGKPAESLLIDAVKYKSVEMPPKRKLSNQQIAALEKWVEMGAPWPQVTSSRGVQEKEKEIDWRFLTAQSDEDLAPILDEYDQAVIRDLGPDGEPVGTMSHILRVYLIDAERNIRNIYSPSFLHPDLLLADILTVAGDDDP